MTQAALEVTPGFSRPQEPHDAWTRDLYLKYGFSTAPSLEEIEAKATELLADLKTALTGAELVLGRRVDGNLEIEPEVLPIITTKGLSGEDRFGLLLLQKEIEKMQAASNPSAG